MEYKTLHKKTINAGKTKGIFKINYNFNPFNLETTIPCRLVCKWNNNVYDTGFIGDNIYNKELNELGFQNVVSDQSCGNLLIDKNEEQPYLIEFEIYTILKESDFKIKLVCPNETDSDFCSTPTPTNTPTPTPTNTPIAPPLRPMNSVIRNHINNTILNRLSGKDINSDAFLYTNNQDPYGKVFERDSRCWLNGVNNISCMSVAQLDGSIWWEKTVTLLSPRHVYISAHWGPCGAGLSGCPDDPVEVLFVDESNNVVSRNIVSTIQGEPGGAFFPEAVGLLDSDVPPNIKFAKVLPSNFDLYFSLKTPIHGSEYVLLPQDTVYTVGIKFTNSDRYNPGLERYKTDTVLLGKIYSFDSGWINTRMSPAGYGASYWGTDVLKDWAMMGLVAGNSSNQQFLIIDNDLILLNNWLSGGSDIFISDSQNYEKINNAMLQLGGGYTLTPVDLESVYNKYK